MTRTGPSPQVTASSWDGLRVAVQFVVEGNCACGANTCSTAYIVLRSGTWVARGNWLRWRHLALLRAEGCTGRCNRSAAAQLRLYSCASRRGTVARHAGMAPPGRAPA